MLIYLTSVFNLNHTVDFQQRSYLFLPEDAGRTFFKSNVLECMLHLCKSEHNVTYIPDYRTYKKTTFQENKENSLSCELKIKTLRYHTYLDISQLNSAKQ